MGACLIILGLPAAISNRLTAHTPVLAVVEAPRLKSFDPAGPETHAYHQPGANGSNAENYYQGWIGPGLDQGEHHTQSDQQKKLPEGYRVFVAAPHRDDLNRTLP